MTYARSLKIKGNHVHIPSVDLMRYQRAVFGAIIASIILYSEGSPITRMQDIVGVPLFLRLPILFLIVGLIAGLIAGTYIWGAISSITVAFLGVIIPLFVSENSAFFLSFIQGFLEVGLTQIISLVSGGLIGGYIMSRYFDDEEYIILNVDEQY